MKSNLEAAIFPAAALMIRYFYSTPPEGVSIRFYAKTLALIFIG
jgi:hypothetical protein